MAANKYNKKKSKVTAIENTTNTEKLRNNIIVTLLTIYTFALFAKSIDYEFVNWDDNSYIVDNMLLRNFSWEGFKNIFTTPVIGMYNPLPFVLYTFIFKFWGLNPQPYNILNILLHLAVIVATFRFIYTLTKRYETATIVALLFAIHPMHVSVVTWASETKTSLYCIFYLSALVCYINYIRSGFKKKHLVYVGLLFLPALLSKPSAVTLPMMLLLLDYYLSRSWSWKLLIEKAPFFILSLVFGIITLLTHIEAGDSIFETNTDYSLFNNFVVSNYSIAFYLNKLFVPLNLCTIYPYPENTPLLPLKYYLSIPVIPLVIYLIYKSGSFRKEILFGVLFFVIVISVMLRIVPSGFFRASNVYTYLSYTGLFFVVGQFFTYVIDNKFSFAHRIKNYVFVFLISLTIFYTYRTTIRISVWQNSLTLFNDIIKKKPKLALAYNNRGLYKLDHADVHGAIADLTKSIELDPNYSPGYNNRAKILVDMKEFDKALADLNIALKINPSYAEAYINRGNIKFFQEKHDEALADYTTAIKFNPKIEVAYKNRAKIMSMKKKYEQALQDLRYAVSLNPEYVDAFIDKGNIHYELGRYENALRNYDKAIAINPKSVDAYNNRAIIKMALKDTLGAQMDAQKVATLRGGVN